ncbi:GOLD domain-containing protein [Plasmodiophora brassicae]|uniref:GOLD domain-containing protein n=1 Tax=Plasmodiophora brassicae TaxID=37360 RepID=A0A0G4INI3_PLABS|nr:hypothetical protein PBRA_005477 [Plasmodiophora brassicae]SPR01830.1 unnamed protein product [Plasmodiophora brassicae]
MRLLLLSTVCTTLAWICSPAPGDEMATTTYTLMLVRNTCDTPPEEEVWDVKRVQFFRRNSSSGKLEEVRWDSIQASGYHPFDKGSKRTSVFEPERVGADDDRFWSGRWDRHKRSWISFEFKAPVKEGPLAVDEIRIVQPGKWSASKVNVSVHFTVHGHEFTRDLDPKSDDVQSISVPSGKAVLSLKFSFPERSRLLAVVANLNDTVRRLHRDLEAKNANLEAMSRKLANKAVDMSDAKLLVKANRNLKGIVANLTDAIAKLQRDRIQPLQRQRNVLGSGIAIGAVLAMGHRWLRPRASSPVGPDPVKSKRSRQIYVAATVLGGVGLAHFVRARRSAVPVVHRRLLKPHRGSFYIAPPYRILVIGIVFSATIVMFGITVCYIRNAHVTRQNVFT